MAVSPPVSPVTVPANDDEGERDDIIIDIDILNRADNNINERYDRSILDDIDPDVNFLHDGLKSLYCSLTTFKDKYKNNSNLSILTGNVRSIAKNFITSLKHDFSIIGITESWLKPSSVNDYTPHNYNHEYDIRSTSP